jgi:plasmid stabilization system protein ParE
MVVIRWTDEAEAWMKDIHSYIAKDDPQAAERVLREIYKRTQILRRFPRSGYRYWLDSDGDIRILLYGHYRIAYILKNNGELDILGVFHSALDIDRYL